MATDDPTLPEILPTSVFGKTSEELTKTPWLVVQIGAYICIYRYFADVDQSILISAKIDSKIFEAPEDEFEGFEKLKPGTVFH